MKKRIINYTFDKTAKTITFLDYSSILLSSILLITNVKEGIDIFLFDDATKGGTISGNVLTLEYDTTAQSNSDPLLILIYDDSEAASDDLQELVLSRLAGLNVLEMAQSSVGEIKVVLGSTSSSANIGTITTVASVSNQVNIGSNAANTIVPDSMNLVAIMGNINNVT